MPPRPLVVTDDDHVLDDVLRIAAAAGVEMGHGRDPSHRSAWRAASVVVLDAALVPRAVAAGLPRRAAVVVVTTGELGSAVLQDCVRLGVSDTLYLPQDQDRMVDLLVDATDDGPGGGRSVAFMGACGGAGASVLAVATAVAAARRGAEALLLDADPWGAGLDLLLGVEQDHGMRWEDLVVGGRLAAATLRRALPTADVGRSVVPVLAPRRVGGEAVGPSAVSAVLDAGRRAGGTTVLDVPRPPAETAAVLETVDLAVLVVPADVRGCFAADRVVRHLRGAGIDCALVVRGPAPGNLGADEVAESLGLSLLATLRSQPSLAREIEQSRVPGAEARSALARTAEIVLDHLDVGR
ncbi:AAA family ATPase [Nakamurella flavida]|uniref:AAA family ATPase n=1 Tax=Nakamurella flavida TaxID=363630 RepID=A0A938YMU0_9ACTN|nr:septum site-determining protein Ssd [Nakamurella flavida]MBM9476262.1 AAA family ATPase [Nakamurella flavida]MDP9779640.1 secretion/DNA translocation related CpaE-like protein [Nakamurella flavida]